MKITIPLDMSYADGDLWKQADPQQAIKRIQDRII